MYGGASTKTEGRRGPKLKQPPRQQQTGVQLEPDPQLQTADTASSSSGRERTMHKEQERVHSRVKQLLGWEPNNGKHREMDKYGMGSRRSLAQFMKESKIDYNNKTVGSHC